VNLLSEETTTEKMEKTERAPQDKVVVRSYTKGIYFYPTMIVGFILFLVDEYAKDVILNTFTDLDQNDYLNYIAAIWFVIFTFNLIVISFDFTLGKVFTGSVLLFAVILVYSVAFPSGLGMPSIQQLLNFGGGASSAFYLWISLTVLIIIVIDLIRARFDYWVFTSNRIEHHRGIFEREMSFSAQNSRVTTQTDDIFERVLFLAGTIFVQDPDRRVWQIANVFGANGKDKRIQDLLSVVRVKTD
jgi:hypothetical protein